MTAPMPPQPPAPPQPAQPHWPGAAVPGGYVSPIPVREANLGDAVKAEWTKIKSLRSTMWTLGVMLLVVIGIGTLMILVADSKLSEQDLTDVTPLNLGFTGVLLGIIPVLTLGVLTISSEYGTGLIRTTLTACPSRTRVLAAKSIVFFALTFVMTLIATVLVALLGEGVLSGRTGQDSTGSEWLKATFGVSIYVALLGLIALAVGAMLRHSAGAITTMLGVVLLPLILAMFLGSFHSLQKALLEYSIPMQLAAIYGTSSDTSTSGPGTGTVMLIAVLATAAALAGAYAVMTKRDA